jgi:hypothetical protein
MYSFKILKYQCTHSMLSKRSKYLVVNVLNQLYKYIWFYIFINIFIYVFHAQVSIPIICTLWGYPFCQYYNTYTLRKQRSRISYCLDYGSTNTSVVPYMTFLIEMNSIKVKIDRTILHALYIPMWFQNSIVLNKFRFSFICINWVVLLLLHNSTASVA